MKFSSSVVVGIAAGLASTAAATPGVVAIDFNAKRDSTHPIARYQTNPLYRKAANAQAQWPRDGDFSGDFAKRDTVTVSLTNQVTFYEIDVKVGTPGQVIPPVIDTGSSDLWAISSNNPFCAANEAQLNEGFIPCQNTTFNYNQSSTFQFNGTSDNFFIQYGDGTFARGRWGTDVVDLGSVKLNNCSIAIGLEANSTQGVFGIGFAGLESTTVLPSGSEQGPGSDGSGSGSGSGNGGSGSGGINLQGTYLNVPQLLKANGDIGSLSYSLYLNDVNAPKGSLLFGGVDHDKYVGTLQTVPIVNNIEGISQPIEMTVILSSVSLEDAKGSNSTVMSGNSVALLDSGTSFTFLPQDAVTSIANAVGAQVNQELGFYVSSCNIQDGDATLTYDFSGATITVPLGELLFELTDENNNPATFSNGEPACALGLLPSDQVILGDSFLRSAYVVYDLDNFEISIANTKYNETSSNVESIGDTVPSAAKAASYSSTQFASNVQFGVASGVFSGNVGGTALAGLSTDLGEASSVGGPIPTGASAGPLTGGASATGGAGATVTVTAGHKNGAMSTAVSGSGLALAFTMILCLVL